MSSAKPFGNYTQVGKGGAIKYSQSHTVFFEQPCSSGGILEEGVMEKVGLHHLLVSLVNV